MSFGDLETAFHAGDRVLTPAGMATVMYRRYASPTFSRIEAYSVRLDLRAAEPGYSGTIYAAQDVRAP